MNHSNYYRYDISYAWRFSNLRSGQPAASDRSLTGGNTTHSADPANCRTPPIGPRGITPADQEALK